MLGHELMTRACGDGMYVVALVTRVSESLAETVTGIAPMLRKPREPRSSTASSFAIRRPVAISRICASSREGWPQSPIR